jgi:hypothetical protein
VNWRVTGLRSGSAVSNPPGHPEHVVEHEAVELILAADVGGQRAGHHAELSRQGARMVRGCHTVRAVDGQSLRHDAIPVEHSPALTSTGA